MNDARYLLGGILGALIVPLLAFVLHVPFLFALVAGAIAFAAVALLLQPRKLFENLDVKTMAAGQLGAAQAVLEQAYSDIGLLEASAKRVPDATMRDRVLGLATQAREACADIEAHPERLSAMRRLLTYYVPRTNDIASSFAEIATRKAVSPEQAQRVQTALFHLEDTYRHYRQQSVSGQAQELDAELDLLDRSIKQDLEKL